jgi:hypothetical protein
LDQAKTGNHERVVKERQSDTKSDIPAKRCKILPRDITFSEELKATKVFSRREEIAPEETDKFHERDREREDCPKNKK